MKTDDRRRGGRSGAFVAGRCLRLAPLILVIAGCAQPLPPPPRHSPPLPDGGSVFFVGNSFFSWEGRKLPEWLAALGKARGPDFVVGGDIVPGDLRLRDFLGHPAVKTALASRAYEVWILQGHEIEPVDEPESFRQAVRDFDAAIRASGGRSMLFMTWEFPWRKFLPSIARAYEAIGQELDIPVIPAGLVYGDCEREHPAGYGRFFLTASAEAPGGSLHQNGLGAALNTYVTYAMLSGRNPGGQAFEAPGNAAGADLLRYLSDRAWARAEQRLSEMGSRQLSRREEGRR